MRHRRTRTVTTQPRLLDVLSDETWADTNEKPFSCSLCHATFPRADVQQKHMRRLHREQSYSEDWDEAAALAAAKTPRSKVACDTCRRRKLRCVGESPCSQCQASNQACTFSRANRTTSISSRQDDTSQRSGQLVPEISICEMEMAINDPMASSAVVTSQRASLSDENQWPTTDTQLLTQGLTQISHPGNLRPWTQAQGIVTPESPPADWLNGPEDLRLGVTETFQGVGYGLANTGQVDSLWDLEDFVSRTQQISWVSLTWLLTTTPRIPVSGRMVWTSALQTISMALVAQSDRFQGTLRTKHD